jgi:GTPase SAR1 family protein
MGQVKSKLSRRRAIDAQAAQPEQILPELPRYLRFRVLIIGRANAGKTSILQRVCDTTESPEIYKLDPWGERERVSVILHDSWWRLRFIIWSGSTRGITRGWAGLFLPVAADHEDPACSVACTMWRTKSYSRIIEDMFSTTPADSKQAVKTSGRP